MKEIDVTESVLKSSQEIARRNRERMDRAGVLAVNIMSAPGSGKTTLLENTIPALSRDYRCAVLVGDLQTSRDADRLGHVTSETRQINTGKGCHLTPQQVASGLDSLNLGDTSYLFIENVGNMVCPAAFDLGEHVRAVLLSVPEGDDKVAKYPTLFQPADVILLTKVDLLDVLDFSRQRVYEDIRRLNTRAPIIELSGKTGQGLQQWLAWLDERRAAMPRR